ncbi:MAG: hypothetical protein AAB510_03250 [Patescibacteria group bacterium]
MRRELTYVANIFIILFIAVYTVPVKTFAVSPTAISINMSPENPKAGESVSITVSSYVASLDGTLISWYVNGKKISSQIGQKTFSTTTPVNGSETTIRAVISLPDGEIEKVVVAKPLTMIMLWQATNSYVPPFYRGKALPTADSEIKVTALPEIKNKAGIISPKNMIYSWKKNYNNDAEGSGYGKNSFTFTNDYLEDSDNIEVIASTVDGLYSTKKNMDIGVVSPKISFYRNDPLLGTLWEQALRDRHQIQDNEVIIAEPYFISPKQIHSPQLAWTWYINDEIVDIVGYRKNIIPLKIEEGVSGISRLKLEIENKYQILETANKTITVEF